MFFVDEEGTDFDGFVVAAVPLVPAGGFEVEDDEVHDGLCRLMMSYNGFGGGMIPGEGDFFVGWGS